MDKAVPLVVTLVALINPPAPPPPACREAPPPPPATTSKSIAVTFAGSVQLQLPTFLKATYVNPPEGVDVGTHAAKVL
jgi:hypothetical protein